MTPEERARKIIIDVKYPGSVYGGPVGIPLEIQIAGAIQGAVLEERKRCAKIAEQPCKGDIKGEYCHEMIAQAIREGREQ